MEFQVRNLGIVEYPSHVALEDSSMKLLLSVKEACLDHPICSEDLEAPNRLFDRSTNNLRLDTWTMCESPRTWRHGRPHYWQACVIIFACEVAERIAFYAISSTLTIYLTTVMQESMADAAKNYNNWGGTTFLTPFIGAFVADAFLGRYWTILWSMVIYCMALIFVAVSMSFEPLRPHCDTHEITLICETPTWSQTGLLYGSLYMMTLGAGGIKACVTAFSADQFDDNDPIQRKERISFMNWWWLSLSSGIMLSAALFPWVQQVADWLWVGAIPTVIVVLVMLAFAFAHPLYDHQIPSGSAFTRVFQVLVVAFKNRNLQLPEDDSDLFEYSGARPDVPSPPSYRLQHTRRLRMIGIMTPYTLPTTFTGLSFPDILLDCPRRRFLDKAAIPNDVGQPPFRSPVDISSWDLCTVTQVEEVKLLLGVLPIWATNIPNSVVFAQVGTFFVNQGRTMDRSMGPNFQVPAASLISFISLTAVTVLPLYDKILVPMISKCTGNSRGITVLQRIGVGLCISTVAIAIAGVVENRRLKTATSHSDSSPVPMSIFWLVPQYCLVGLYEVFIVVGQNEFFYLQAPPNMKSLGTALFFGNVAVGNFLSSLLVTAVDSITKGKSPENISWVDNDLSRSHLDYYYWLLAGLNFVFLPIFVYCARNYKYNYSITPVRHITTWNGTPPITSRSARYESCEQELPATTSPIDNTHEGDPIRLMSPAEIRIDRAESAASIETDMTDVE